MPNLEEHCKHTFERYGVEGRDVHRWLDEPSRKYAGRHREFRHDSDTVKLAGEVFGRKYDRALAENVALDHIMLDHKEEIQRREKKCEVADKVTASEDWDRERANKIFWEGIKENERKLVLVTAFAYAPIVALIVATTMNNPALMALKFFLFTLFWVPLSMIAIASWSAKWNTRKKRKGGS